MKVLIVYSKMIIGGSTTSLLSLLNSFDYSKYQVDLQLYSNEGELQNEINPRVNILEPLEKRNIKRAHKYRLDYYFNGVLSRYMSKKYNSKPIQAQYMARFQAACFDEFKTEYDTAISFLEFFPMEYVARNIKAKKKIGWIHVDFVEAGLQPKINAALFKKMDALVFVSNSCESSFLKLYPECLGKTEVIQNVLEAETVNSLSKRKPEKELPEKVGLEFVSVCRIVFSHKGLDRVLNAFSRLRREKLLHTEKWYVIGDGKDYKTMRSFIVENKLEDNIILLGSCINPFSIEKRMDVFLLPSRYEGKPMAVTEAQMLGIVPVVCNYSSANEQIENGVDGFIVNNDDNDIYNYIRKIITGEYNIVEMRHRILNTDYSNKEEIKKIYQLIGE